MKRPELHAPALPDSRVDPLGSIHQDMHFVHKDGPSVRVRHYAIQDERGTRFAAELTAVEAGVERAIIDALSLEELKLLLEPAARAFALAVRLRLRASAKPPVP